jgi:hypothetical protein
MPQPGQNRYDNSNVLFMGLALEAITSNDSRILTDRLTDL